MKKQAARKEKYRPKCSYTKETTSLQIQYPAVQVKQSRESHALPAIRCQERKVCNFDMTTIECPFLGSPELFEKIPHATVKEMKWNEHQVTAPTMPYMYIYIEHNT